MAPNVMSAIMWMPSAFQQVSSIPAQHSTARGCAAQRSLRTTQAGSTFGLGAKGQQACSRADQLRQLRRLLAMKMPPTQAGHRAGSEQGQEQAASAP